MRNMNTFERWGNDKGRGTTLSALPNVLQQAAGTMTYYANLTKISVQGDDKNDVEGKSKQIFPYLRNEQLQCRTTSSSR